MKTHKFLLVLVVLSLLLPAQPARAEGSDELMDFESAQGGIQRYGLVMGDGLYLGIPGWSVFYVYLQAGETLHLGSNTIGTGNGDIYVWAPGAEVYTDTYPSAAVFGTAIITCTDQTGKGLIDSRTKEDAGPLPNAGGYDSCQYTATASGIYPLIFTAVYTAGIPLDMSVTGAIGTQAGRAGVHAWDATVRDAGGGEQTGRLFTNAFNFFETDDTPPELGPDQEMYTLTRDGHQYRLQFDEMSGAGWLFLVNNKGVQNRATGEPTYKSWLSAAVDDPGDAQFVRPPQDPDTAADVTYKIFVNPPDPVVITGTGGLSDTLGYAGAPVTAPAATNLTFDGSSAGGGDGWAPNPPWGSDCQFTFDSASDQDGQAFALVIDADRNGSFDDPVDRRLTGILDSAGNSVDFDGLDGNGTPLADDYTYAVRLASQGGEIHYPMSDVENLDGFHIERLTNLGAGDVHRASYDDYNGAALTNASPTSLPQGGDSSPHGGDFRGFDVETGNEDMVDTWAFIGSAPANTNFVVGVSANLKIVKTAIPATTTAGGTIDYTLVFSNAGTGTGSGIVITDVVPISATVTNIVSSGDAAITETTTTPPTYTWDVDDLDAGEGGVITITAQVISALTDTIRFTNTAAIHSDDNDDSDLAAVTVMPEPDAIVGGHTEPVRLQALFWPWVVLLVAVVASGAIAATAFKRRAA